MKNTTTATTSKTNVLLRLGNCLSKNAFFLSALLLSTAVCAGEVNIPGGEQGYFEMNKGQLSDENGNAADHVHFSTRFNGLNIFFTSNGVVYYYKEIRLSTIEKIKRNLLPNPYSPEEWEQINKELNAGFTGGYDCVDSAYLYRIDIEFPGADFSHPVALSEDRLIRVHDYYIPRYPEGLRNVPTYSRIMYKNIYEGIDLVYYFTEGKLKYDFLIAPGADPAHIKIVYKGQQGTEISENGSAVIRSFLGDFIENKPYTYQGTHTVHSAYTLNKDTLGFSLGTYDKQQPLVIDPELTWSTYYNNGGTSYSSYISNIEYDSKDNLYFVGASSSITYPVISPGGSAYYLSTTTGETIILHKFNSKRELVWCTYYKGTKVTTTIYYGKNVLVDNNDNVYFKARVKDDHIAGGTTTTLPVYNPGGGAYYQVKTRVAAFDGTTFLLKFDQTGDRRWATLFAAPYTSDSKINNINVYDFDVDASNKLYIVGKTYAPGSSWETIPLLSYAGGYNKSSVIESETPWVAQFSSSGTLEWSTYISQSPASSYNQGYTISAGKSGELFVLGSATTNASGNFTAVNPGGAYIDQVASAGRKISIYKFNTARNLVWATLFGGDQKTGSYIIWQDPYRSKVAGSGDLYIVGRANTTNFPTLGTAGSYLTATKPNNTNTDNEGVIVRFSSAGALKWSTYYGGVGGSGTEISSIGIDSGDNIIIAGKSNTPNIAGVTMSGGYNQASTGAGGSTFLAMFNSSNVIKWASYYGDNVYSAYQWGMPFGSRSFGCSFKFIIAGYVSSSTGIPAFVNPGNGARYTSVASGTSYSDFIAEFNNQALPSSSANNMDSKTCPCAGSAYTHFVPDNTNRAILSINPNGQDLGAVTTTAYVEAAAAPVTINACSSAAVQSKVLGRRFKVTPANQPSGPVNVRLYFEDAEYTQLRTQANANSNPLDNTTAIGDLKVTRFHATSNTAYENGVFTDNCGNGAISIHSQVASGNAADLFSGYAATGRYIEFTTSEFSELWIHGSTTNSPLPVEMLYYTAGCVKEKGVELKWSTASEQNNSFFTVERSKDLENWTKVGTTEGRGTVSVQTDYSLYDRFPSPGVNYYRLIQVDYDGIQKEYGPISSACAFSSDFITVVPSPAEESFAVHFNSSTQYKGAMCVFTDAFGRKIYEEMISIEEGETIIYPAVHLSPGIYFVSLEGEKQFSPAKFMVK